MLAPCEDVLVLAVVFVVYWRLVVVGRDVTDLQVVTAVVKG